MNKQCVFVLLMVALTTTGIAAQKKSGVSIKYKELSLAFVQQPLQEDGKLQPLIEASGAKGSKERFGFLLGGAPPTTPAIEILDANGNVLKALSINDLLGKGVAKEDKLLPNTTQAKPRRAENSYSVRLANADAQVIVRAIATGDELQNDQQLVVTFALQSKSAVSAAMRVSLPVSGTLEESKGGFIITAKDAKLALATSVFPDQMKVEVAKNKITVASALKTTEPSSETAFVWFLIKGVSSSSPTDAKTQAQRVIESNALSPNEPRLVIVNAADKDRLATADTASYSIICANIGAGEATNIVLGNPIPNGARYVEGSATTAGTVFNLEKGTATKPDNLQWMLPQPLKPGEERIVSFKVVVQ